LTGQGGKTLRDYVQALIRGERRGLWAGLQRGGLRLASVPYGWASALRNCLYDRGWKTCHRVTVPVISVGNLTVGGTGKTPCVEYVARRYRAMDLRVAILSRGYGSREGPNDEALVLEENLPDVPHLQGPDRVLLARTAIEELESEVLVLDDGFQHRRLARNLDLVLLDATEPWGHGALLPRGLLRESPRGLKRADVVMLTRCDQVQPETIERLRLQVRRWAPTAPVILTSHRPAEWINAAECSQALDALRRTPTAVFCGIGNPDAFRRTLLDLGMTVKSFRVFPDHHAYARTDVDDLRHWARQEATHGVVVTTQKDLVKLRLTHLGERELWALKIALRVEEGQDELDRNLKAALG
jgi:tetraacyldisaccharide 4'-kinase